ncbi:MAG: acyl-CoA desaturase [Candidatus Buchananbacteria bacterium]|nr:acyl-CoA desaturase [Candidatus Buchananbacteria bacterium]
MSIKKEINVFNAISIPLVHFVGLIVAPLYLIFIKFSWLSLILAVVWFFLCSFSITAGYHRLFTHRSYKCNFIVEWLWLLFGAASLQGSARDWVYTHLLHHASDTNYKIEDPHDIKKGFWWAHWRWLFYKSVTGHVAFLEKKSFQFQHKHYLFLVIVFGFVWPGIIACLWHDFIGGVLLAGFLRVAVEWHMTWTINSIAHTYGTNLFKRPDQSRNNYFFSIFFVALGEMYHSFHHQFPRDYRNGHRKFDFDPSKWLIYLLSKIGWTWDLWITPSRDVKRALENARKSAYK